MSILTHRQNQWNPFKEMEDLHQRLQSLLSRDYGRALARNEGNGEDSAVPAAWVPLVDIVEDETGYEIKAELPEVKREDVKVTQENGVLTLSGSRNLEKAVGGQRYHRLERAYGQFVRSFTLPDDAEVDKVTAEFKGGVLRVRVAKAEKARPRAVDIQVG